MKIQHILITSDLSPESLRPCLPAASLAKQLGARITLLSVVPELMAAPHGAALAPPVRPLGTEKEMGHARLVLEEQKATFDPELTVDIQVDVTGDDRVPRAIVEYAEKNDVDLIAIATHGRTGIRHLALGSVAEAVLRRSAVPVMVFPPMKD